MGRMKPATLRVGARICEDGATLRPPQKIPKLLLEGGGCIRAIDHLFPNGTPLSDVYRRTCKREVADAPNKNSNIAIFSIGEGCDKRREALFSRGGANAEEGIAFKAVREALANSRPNETATCTVCALPAVTEACKGPIDALAGGTEMAFRQSGSVTLQPQPTQVLVRKVEDVMEALSVAERACEDAGRAHWLVTVRVGKGCLAFVDLANFTSDIHREQALAMNALAGVFLSLQDGTKPPWRDSRLTRLLQGVMPEGSSITLLANVIPGPEHAKASVAALNFIARARATPGVGIHGPDRVLLLPEKRHKGSQAAKAEKEEGTEEEQPLTLDQLAQALGLKQDVEVSEDADAEQQGTEEDSKEAIIGSSGQAAPDHGEDRKELRRKCQALSHRARKAKDEEERQRARADTLSHELVKVLTSGEDSASNEASKKQLTHAGAASAKKRATASPSTASRGVDENTQIPLEGPEGLVEEEKNEDECDDDDDGAGLAKDTEPKEEGKLWDVGTAPSQQRRQVRVKQRQGEGDSQPSNTSDEGARHDAQVSAQGSESMHEDRATNTSWTHGGEDHDGGQGSDHPVQRIPHSEGHERKRALEEERDCLRKRVRSLHTDKNQLLQDLEAVTRERDSLRSQLLHSSTQRAIDGGREQRTEDEELAATRKRMHEAEEELAEIKRRMHEAEEGRANAETALRRAKVELEACGGAICSHSHSAGYEGLADSIYSLRLKLEQALEREQALAEEVKKLEENEAESEGMKKRGTDRSEMENAAKDVEDRLQRLEQGRAAGRRKGMCQLSADVRRLQAERDQLANEKKRLERHTHGSLTRHLGWLQGEQDAEREDVERYARAAERRLSQVRESLARRDEILREARSKARQLEIDSASTAPSRLRGVSNSPCRRGGNPPRLSLRSHHA